MPAQSAENQNKTDCRLNDMLLQVGQLKIPLVAKYSDSKYYFEIPDASGYKNALKKLVEL